MSDVANLWSRIEEAKKRLGVADEAQIKRIQDIGEQVKQVRVDLTERCRDIERHRAEVAALRRENEQLRRMLHGLLLAIERRNTGPLKEIMKDLEGQVTALAPLVGGPKEAGKAPAVVKAPAPEDGPPGKAKAAPRATAAPAVASPARTAMPSERDSRWLQEIMERARELSGEDAAAPHAAAPAAPSQGALT